MLSNKYTYLDESVLNYINTVISNRPEFDEKKFAAWLESNSIQSKSNPSAFVNKCFTNELNKGTFNKDPKLINPKISCQPLFNALDKHNLLKDESTLIIDVANEYLLKNGLLEVEELKELNHSIVNYLIENELDSEQYIPCLMKSKTLSGKFIEWEKITNEALRLQAEWDRIINSLPKVEEIKAKQPWEKKV